MTESVDVEIPYGTLVPVERADAITVLGTPHGRDVILATCEEQITVVIELDDGNRPLVTL